MRDDRREKKEKRKKKEGSRLIIRFGKLQVGSALSTSGQGGG